MGCGVRLGIMLIHCRITSRSEKYSLRQTMATYTFGIWLLLGFIILGVD